MSLLDDAFALISSTQRSIAAIIPDVVIEERHFDKLIITEHPVETGAAITDHSFRLPAEVVMRIGFSNSTARTEGWVQEAYQMLIALQRQRQPFNVTTGKRAYSNMLIEAIEVTTDPSSEWMLNCSVSLKEIIIVSTAQASTSPSAMSPDTSAQTMPDQTTGVGAGGNVQLGTADGLPTFAQATNPSGQPGVGVTITSGGAPSGSAGFGLSGPESTFASPNTGSSPYGSLGTPQFTAPVAPKFSGSIEYAPT